MVTRGEFSLIIASVALGGAGTTLAVETANTIYAFAVGYILVMSILGPLLMQHSKLFERKVADWRTSETSAD
jgi:CPA2 family monovalent cation:H+ antiporter-2